VPWSFLRLTFAELETTTSLTTAEFLALHHTGIPSQKLLGFERGVEIGIHFVQGTGQGEQQGIRLSRDTAPSQIRFDIVLVKALGGCKSFVDLLLKGFEWEILVVGTAIDRDAAGARGYINPGNGSFPPTMVLVCGMN